jgi:GTP-binding protein HflX
MTTSPHDQGPRAAILTLNKDTVEMEELARSAGYHVVAEILQRRDRPETGTFVGKGKLGEIKEFLSSFKLDLLLVNGDLKPMQHYSLENALKVECIDRIRLVLNIFTDRANNQESRLQVERARLEYEMPLLREWIHSAKMGEHPGFLGGGEYAVDVYYDLARKRRKRIDEDLRQIGKTNLLRRAQRKKKGFYLVSLAGYTNAGKSSLLNAMTGETAVVDNRMFSTLSTTTRVLPTPSKQILLTDTVGFLHDLPHFLIESFKSTIDEIFMADLVLLVLDASDPEDEMARKLETSSKILFPEVDPDDVVLVLNKIDLVRRERGEIEEWARGKLRVGAIAFVSALTGEGVQSLLGRVKEHFGHEVSFELVLPPSGEEETVLGWLRKETRVVTVTYGEEVRVIAEGRSDLVPEIKERVRRAGGSMKMIE